MSADRPTVVLLGDRSAATAAVFHALSRSLRSHAEVRAILEESPSRIALARRRARRLGWPTVVGQVAFVGLILPVLRRRGKRRAMDIARQHGLELAPVPGAARVASVNDARTIALISECAPRVVVVHGTRIIGRPVLDAITVPVLNLHAGITPRYRGVHGGYWALRDGQPDLAGSTVHLVDAGIDTGGILAQAAFTRGHRDTITTYPFLHLACGLPLLCDQVRSVLDGDDVATVPPMPGAQCSQLRWHPTAWDYLRAWARQGVR